MFHAKLFATDAKYRAKMFSTLPCWTTTEPDVKLQPHTIDGIRYYDRPLIVQFCANDAEYLIEAAKHVAPFCDAIDLNLGCPQDIARRGRYGSFLMDDWPLIGTLLSQLVASVSVPVTAKIRVFADTPEGEAKTLAYVHMLRSTGISMLTVHGRQREQRGHKTGLANWRLIRAIKQANPDFPIVANGNILYARDIVDCLAFTGCDAVMSSEGNLYNPAIFAFSDAGLDDDDDDVTAAQFPAIVDVVTNYMAILATLRRDFDIDAYADFSSIRGHLFKLYRPCLSLAPFLEYRSQLGTFSSLEQLHALVAAINARLLEHQLHGLSSSSTTISSEANKRTIIETLPPSHPPSDKQAEVLFFRRDPVVVPHWRCQPYIRPPFLPHFYFI